MEAVNLGTGRSLGNSVKRRSPRALPGHQDNEQHFLAPPRKLPETPTHPHPDCLLLGCLDTWLCDFRLFITPLSPIPLPPHPALGILWPPARGGGPASIPLAAVQTGLAPKKGGCSLPSTVRTLQDLDMPEGWAGNRPALWAE